MRLKFPAAYGLTCAMLLTSNALCVTAADLAVRNPIAEPANVVVTVTTPAQPEVPSSSPVAKPESGDKTIAELQPTSCEVVHRKECKSFNFMSIVMEQVQQNMNQQEFKVNVESFKTLLKVIEEKSWENLESLAGDPQVCETFVTGIVMSVTSVSLSAPALVKQFCGATALRESIVSWARTFTTAEPYSLAVALTAATTAMYFKTSYRNVGLATLGSWGLVRAGMYYLASPK